MDDFFTPVSEDTTAIITAQEYRGVIKKSPALPPLSEKDMARADELARALIRSEDQLDDIVSFGSEAQTAMTQVTKDIMRGVRIGTLDEVIQLSDGVLGQIHTLDIGDLSPKARRVLLVLHETRADIAHRIQNFFRRYELVSTRLDRQEAELFTKESASTKRYYKDAELAKAAIGILQDAQLRLMAIKLYLDGEYGYAELERRQKAVADEKVAARMENRTMDFTIPAAADRYDKYLARLEGKASDLQKVILSSYQMSITIRMMADNENIIRQKLYDIRIDLLPQWRTLIAIAYQAYQQQGIARCVQQLNDAEADLRKQTADRIEMAAQGVTELMARPIIDLESMQYYNEKLVASLDILKTASIEARKIRESAEEEMRVLLGQLGEAASITSVRKE